MSVAQVYERHAITSHVEKSHNDPITRLPLRVDQLTPVYVLRVRAAEYRESAAAACIEAACSADCISPVSVHSPWNFAAPPLAASSYEVLQRGPISDSMALAP